MPDEDIQTFDPSAPDANASDAVEETTTAAPAESSTAVTEPDESEHPRKGVQKRLDELTRNWREAERREQALLAIIREREAKETAAPEPIANPKTLADFDFDESKYQAHLIAEVERRAVAAAERKLRETEERSTAERRASGFRQRSAEFAKTVEDYESTVYDQSLPITQAMAEVIQESDDGPAIAYHLGKNPEVAAKIAQLPPIAAAREIGRIEARLEYERARAKEKPAVSSAPAPTPKIDGTEPGLTVKAGDPESEKLSMNDWMRRREKELRRHDRR